MTKDEAVELAAVIGSTSTQRLLKKAFDEIAMEHFQVMRQSVGANNHHGATMALGAAEALEQAVVMLIDKIETDANQ